MRKENKEFNLLWSWLNSWKQCSGYGGILHHAIHGTVNWDHAKLVPSYTYQPLMNGLLNLYDNTKNEFWLNQAIQMSSDLIKILDKACQFKYSGFEFAPGGGSLVHTINPLFAFYRLYEITKDENLLRISKKVLESVVCIYWRGYNLAGPFNMTLMAAAAMAEYGKLTGDWRLYENYGKPCFELVKEHRVGNEHHFIEGLYYRLENDHTIVFPWYNCVKADAMLRLARATNDKYWEEEGLSILNKVKKIIRSDYKLPHSFVSIDGQYKMTQEPVLIAPAAYLFMLLQKYKLFSNSEVDESLKALISNQTSIGFVRANDGYDWRSQIGVTAWNSFVFEYFSQNFDLDLDSKQNIKEIIYTAKYSNISIKETVNSLELSYFDSRFIKIDKQSGKIQHLQIDSSNSSFHVPHNLLKYKPNLIKLNKQRHLGVSYIDPKGNGIWLSDYSGSLSIWSPKHKLSLKGNDENSIINKGKRNYESFSVLVYCLLKPFLYNDKINISFLFRYFSKFKRINL